jgi:hypothetical protein
VEAKPLNSDKCNPQGLNQEHKTIHVPTLQGYLTHEKPPPPQEHHRSLGIVQLFGPTGWRFLVSEVTLHPLNSFVSQDAAAVSEMTPTPSQI